MRTAAALLVLLWLAALTGYDLRQHRLPNLLTLSGAVIVLLGAAAADRGVAAAVGALGLAGAYLVVHLIAPGGMGAGDVKLAIGVGGLTGAFGMAPWLLAALGAPLLTVLAALVLRRRVLPHGPGMCAATVAALAYC